MIRNFRIKFALLSVLFLSSGCLPLATQPSSASEVESQTATPPTITTITIPNKVSQTATFTPSPTATEQPPTETSQPTLSAEGMKSLLFELVKDNGGCRLSCLWGLTPGQTDIQTVNGFMAQFYYVETSDVYVNVRDFGDVGGFSLIYNEDRVYISVLFGYSLDDNSGLEMLTMFAYPMYAYGTTPEGALDLRPQYGDAAFTQALQYYTLPHILSTYGPPSRVLLATWPDDPERPARKEWPFSLVILYPEQGIFFEYVTLRESQGSNFAGCPSKAHIDLGVWSPERALPLNRIVQAGSVINELNIDYFKPVEEATSLTLDEFYETFKNPDTTVCLETPIDFWKP